MKIHYSLLLAGLLAGCAGSVHHIGNIGQTDFYAVKSRSIQGPNFSALAIRDAHGDVQVHTVIGGPGIGQHVIAAGGAIGASAVLRPARSETTVSATGGNGTGTGGVGGGSSNRVTAGASIENSGNSTDSGGSTTTNNGAHDNQNGAH